MQQFVNDRWDEFDWQGPAAPPQPPVCQPASSTPQTCPPAPCPPYYEPPYPPWYPTNYISFGSIAPAYPSRGALWWNGIKLQIWDGAGWMPT